MPALRHSVRSTQSTGWTESHGRCSRGGCSPGLGALRAAIAQCHTVHDTVASRHAKIHRRRCALVEFASCQSVFGSLRWRHTCATGSTTQAPEMPEAVSKWQPCTKTSRNVQSALPAPVR
eukprot:5223611-Prymnesium_polylepis.2